MKRLKVDFVSDVACPWCAIGLASFVEAVGRLQDQLEVELHFQPFELNRNMPPEGENLNEHIANKYGSNAAQIEENRRNLTAIAAESGLTFNLNRDSRIWNTFDAHRLMYWAEKVGNPLLLKQALFKANFTDGRSMSDPDVLTEIAVEAGLNGERAREILTTETYLDDVDERMNLWLERDIRGVPAIIFDDRHIVEGGQSADTFEKVLRKVAGLEAAPTGARA